MCYSSHPKANLTWVYIVSGFTSQMHPDAVKKLKDRFKKLFFSVYMYLYNMLNFTRFLISYDLLEERRIDDVIIGNFLSLLCKTIRFHVAVRLFSQKAVGTSVTHSPNGSCATFLFCKLWRHLWSITEQTHGNMESIC